MSCCGKHRTQLTFAANSSQKVPRFLFEYVGKTRLIVVGPATRISYAFHKPGARVLVDSRDRASLASIPVLRQV